MGNEQRDVGRPYRVVVLGAGYAGVLAANRILATISSRKGPNRTPAEAVEVTVVNPRPDFVQRIRLHEVAAGSAATAAVPLREVLHPAATVHLGWAHRIDAEARTVHGKGWSMPYDSLVYSVGSRPATGVPGSAEHARPLGDPDAAVALRADVEQLRPGSAVVVVGGGLTGIETAAELSERRPDLSVRLVASGRIGTDLAARGRRVLLASLDRLGVVRHEGARVAEVRPGRLVLADGTEVGFDACAWAGSMVAPALAADSGLATDALGRLLVDETLRHRAYPEIVGAGDAVAPPASVAAHLRMSCAAALPLGAHAADVVLAAVDTAQGQPAAVRPLSVGFVVRCVSLGRARGLVQLVHPDDEPRASAVGGRPAALVKEQICRYTLNVMIRQRGSAGAFRGVPGPRAKAAATAPTVARQEPDR
jgi:NADH:ubiquinone reductase (H+-translocating)